MVAGSDLKIGISMRKAIYTWTLIGISLVALVLTISGSILYGNIRSLYENFSWVAHTHEVMATLESLLSTVTDAESSQRGFLMTGDEEHLTPYSEALARHRQELQRASELTADNPDQVKRLQGADASLAKRIAELNRILDLRRTEGFEQARDAMLENRGRQLMGDIRGRIDEMLQVERELLAEREKSNIAAFDAARANAVLATLAGLVALAGFGLLVVRHLRFAEQSAAVIHRERELLRAMLSSIGDGVIATDVQGRITLLNAIAQKLTGWRPEDAAGQPLEAVFCIVNEESRQPVPNPATRALREGQIVGLANHTVLIAKNGVEWPLDDSAAPIRDPEGKVAGAILIFREISDRKQQERLLREQSSALAEANHRKDEFLATLAHELRNPLSPISNALQLWPFVEDNRVELDRLRGLMVRQLRQMTRLIDDLLDVSRITRGKIQLYREELDLTKVIHEAVESVAPQIQAGAQQLEVALPEEPLPVEGDGARLMQVFGNILNNAAKYTGRGGQIRVRAQKCDGHAVVRVGDTGPGIAPEMLNEIFEMFRQADTSLERAHGGLGIGLTLVKRLVEEHGGSVEARSQGLGTGSEFIVTLPLLPQAGESRSTPLPARRNADQLAAVPRHRILVVDDVRASAQTLAMMLRAIGQVVAEANDGQAAIDWVAQHEPDVVFLDIAMPGLSGYDVARQLRAQWPGLVLVALTGYGQEEDRKRAIAAGFNHHVIKPTSIDALKRLLLTVPTRV